MCVPSAHDDGLRDQIHFRHRQNTAQRFRDSRAQRNENGSHTLRRHRGAHAVAQAHNRQHHEFDLSAGTLLL